jgi:hypothetical protein
LSQKTIERHSSGTHVPTRINVTLAATARKRPNIDPENYLSDDSTDSTDLAFSLSDLDDKPNPEAALARNPAQEYPPEPHPEHALELEPAVDWNTADELEDAYEGRFDAETLLLDNMLRDSWSTCRSQVDSDDEEENFEGKDDSGDSDSDLDLGCDWEGDGIRNGLAMDELVEEDLQRLIAEFSAPFFFIC